MSKNSSLSQAKKAKNDEFYTRLTDIEKELGHYWDHFKGKTILCNCDDPFESNFFKYFYLNFNVLGLKKLIATSYADSPISYHDFSPADVLGKKNANSHQAYKAVINKLYDANGDGREDLEDVIDLFKNGTNTLEVLKGDGDFRSDECIELLKETDIVVTNPPFSLFRPYMATLMEYNKKFIVIGNQNAITYKEIFPLLKNDEIWLGYNHPAPKLFYVPNQIDGRKNLICDDHGQLLASFGNICWFTNLDIQKRHEDLILVHRYNNKDYPKYDNYDAIEVSKVVNIPADYDGVMGVPITFLDKYNPEQFEIVKFRKGDDDKDLIYSIGGKVKQPYFRILISNKHPKSPNEPLF